MNLGLLLKNVDVQQALLYFRRAADQGATDALGHIDELVRGDPGAPG